MNDRPNKLSCSDCGVVNCYRREKEFPAFCLTVGTSSKEIDKTNKLYTNDETIAKISHAAAEIEGLYYGKLTRAEEIIAFAKKTGAKKIGIATCVGLMNEARIFAKILKAKGLESYCVICKVGSTDKTEVGVAEDLKVKKGCHESLCNPILQARLLNRAKTDLNVIVGLCVGHDSLFIKYSKALVTTLITKDRVMGHNPAAALYTSGFYYARLLEETDDYNG
ncbi:MAG: hypothetical protein CVU89_12390 [Firmicutes bacterium HGW-Firmicutes-14]|nr:MAG: hypothetical protein CVU89_12390 [Firmicutes bacterium HGW-Firmicutes-14]